MIVLVAFGKLMRSTELQHAIDYAYGAINAN